MLKKKPITKKYKKKGGTNIQEEITEEQCNSETLCKALNQNDEILDSYFTEINDVISHIKDNLDEFVKKLEEKENRGGIFTVKYRIPIYDVKMNKIEKYYKLDRDYPYYNENTEQPIIFFKNDIVNYVNTLKYIKKQMKYLNSLKWYEKRAIRDYTSKPYFFYSLWKVQYNEYLISDPADNDKSETHPKKNFTFIKTFLEKNNNKYAIGNCFLPQIFIVLFIKTLNMLVDIEEDLIGLLNILYNLNDPKINTNLLNTAYIDNFINKNSSKFTKICGIYDEKDENIKLSKASQLIGRLDLKNMNDILKEYKSNIKALKELKKLLYYDTNINNDTSDSYKVSEYNNKKEYFVPEHIKFIKEEDWHDIFKLFDERLNKIIDKAPDSDNDLYVFRGSTSNYVIKAIIQEIAKNGITGSTLINRFSSCSLDFCISYFYQNSGKCDTKQTDCLSNSIMYKIHVPKNIKTLLLIPLSAAPEEMEILIPSSKKYKMAYIKEIKSLNINEFTFNKNKKICIDIDNLNNMSVHELEIVDIRSPDNIISNLRFFKSSLKYIIKLLVNIKQDSKTDNLDKDILNSINIEKNDDNLGLIDNYKFFDDLINTINALTGDDSESVAHVRNAKYNEEEEEDESRPARPTFVNFVLQEDRKVDFCY